jgi:hypothetical protein
MSLQQTLINKYKEQLTNLKNSAKKAQDWFTKKVKTLTGNEIMTVDRPRLITREQITPKLTGRMIMFFYDPKLKETLPYYDRFPLVIVVKLNKKGFMGLNLHYLPYDLRAKLLDGLFTIYKQKHLNENKKLQLSYDLLRQSSRLRYFKPCLKQYLNGHLRSKFYVVDPEEWEMVLTLPTERFEKKDKKFVWEQSRRSLGMGSR